MTKKLTRLYIKLCNQKRKKLNKLLLAYFNSFWSH